MVPQIKPPATQLMALKIRLPLVPPNPNEFEIVVFIFASLAVFGT
jgi:hypothetical protein